MSHHLRRPVPAALRRVGALATALLASAGLLASCSGGSAAPKATQPPQPAVTVMTRNLYFGADLTPLFRATGSTLGPAATAAYQQMLHSDVPARLDRVASEISSTRPDLVALQEAVVWSVLAPGHRSAVVKYDFVKLLLSDLSRMGDSYKVAVASNGFTGALPVPDVGLVSLQDRDVILVRSGDAAVSVSDPRSGHYEHFLTVHVVGVGVKVVRGWASVDVRASGRGFRVVATHLEAYSNPTRDAQATELIHLVSSSTQPTLVLGDVNSAASGPGDTAYVMMRHAGFGDAWASVHPNEPGYSCCRSADLRTGSLDQRIDMIFTRGAFTATKASLVGTTSSSRTASGLWPSDHAGVVATLVPPAS